MGWIMDSSSFPPDMPTGQCIALSPLVARVLAPNPSAFTFTGTQTYVVGDRDVAVIDPGPRDPAHVGAVLAAIGDRPVRAILCTHTHNDHSPAAAPLAQATGAPVIGCAFLAIDDHGPRADAPFDQSYAPESVMEEGDAVGGDGWTLRALATPGHTSNHLCFALEQEEALFTGDHVMGWSTSVVSPPDGNMTDYLVSLERLLGRDDRQYLPAHGEPIDDPRRLVRGMIGHRRMREGQILRFLRERGATDVPSMVAEMYRGIDVRLHGAAGRSVLAHLLDLQQRDQVRSAEDTLWEIA